MKTKLIKAAFYFIFIAMAALSVQANNIINWGTSRGISGDPDVSTNGTLVGTYSPYLIVTGGNPITVNGVTFQANSLNAATSGMTNSTGMGINSSLTDANYANLLSGASVTPFDTDGQGYIAISNLTVGASYQIEIWAENTNDGAVDQWENFWTLSTADQSSAVNYDVSGTGNGQYVVGTFTAANSDEEITWNEWANNGGISSASGQGQINLLELRKISTPPPQNQIVWGPVQQISGNDPDVVTNGLLIGTYAPYLILNPGAGSMTVNGLAFQSNSLHAVTSGMTNSPYMGTNTSLADPNYAALLSAASVTPFNTSGVGYILFTNIMPGNQYEIQIWAQDANLVSYNQWENFWAASSSDQSQPVNYDNNGSTTAGGGIGEYVTGTFTPTASNSVVQITWNEWANNGGVSSAFGQGQINLLQVRLLQNPPTITQQPPATSYVPYGGSVTLTAAADGSPTLAYQWYETNLTAMTGFAVSGATNTSLTLSNLTTSSGYYLAVTNDYGSTNSAIASVIVYQSPVLVSQLPVTYTNPMTLYAGANSMFSVTALGVTTPGYRWFTNGVLDRAATTSTLLMANVQAGAFNNYCIVTNSYGSATSMVWTASVTADPTNSSGGLAPYPQAVLSLNPIGYWRLNDTNLDGTDDGAGDDGYICHDYAGGNDGIFTNTALGQPPYNPTSDPSDSSALFGSTIFSDSDANSIAGINFGSPAGTSKAFTVEAWVNGFTQSKDAGIVTLGYGAGGEQFNLDCGSSGGVSPSAHAFRFFIRDASGAFHGVSSTIAPGSGTWYHLAGVVDEISGQTVTFYINGQSVGSAAVASGSGILPSSLQMSIGARMSGQNTTFDTVFAGYINDVAIFNYALTAAQVAGEYAAGGTSVAPFFVPAPETNATAAATTTLTIPVTAIGTPPIGYTWENLNTSAIVASGAVTNSTSLNATLTYSNVPAAWNGNQLELTVTNAYGSTNALVTLSIPTVNLNPTNIVAAVTNNQLHLSWPTDHTGWQLQAETNRLSAGISTNWVNVAGSTGTNQVVIPINPANGSVFYRLMLQ